MTQTCKVGGGSALIRTPQSEGADKTVVATGRGVAMLTLYKRAKLQEEFHATAAQMSSSGTPLEAVYDVETPLVEWHVTWRSQRPFRLYAWGMVSRIQRKSLFLDRAQPFLCPQ